jgi:hypothetical protein
MCVSQTVLSFSKRINMAYLPPYPSLPSQWLEDIKHLPNERVNEEINKLIILDTLSFD